MLEGLMQGLAIWLYGLILEIVEFVADSLLQVFNMDLAYFEANVPVTREIVNIILAAGWAILIGNLVFQAIKSMMSGIGFEGEDPKILFCRTFVFAFLLLASRQICEIGLGITSRINTLLQTPDAVRIELPPLDTFAMPSSWLLVLIIGIVMMFQVVKFFFEIAERYVVLVVLTILAPLAFGVGGSKNTEDIFKGWVRIFGSACLMMVMNTVFLKLLLSALSSVPTASGMFPWFLLVVAIARVARKIDDIVARIGLNTARTGEPIGRGGIMYPIMVARQLGSIVSKTAAANKSSPRPPSSGRQPGSSAPPSPSSSSPSSSGGGASQPQGNGGSAAHSGSTTHADATSPPPPTHGPGGTGGTAPTMSTPSTGSERKEAPPSRPPVGVGTRTAQQAGDNKNQQQRTATDGQGKQPLSVNSQAPGGVQSNTGRQSARQDDAAGRGKPSRSAPPLSVNSPTSDTHKPGQNPSDASGVSPTSANSADAQRRTVPRKSANVDIYRNDESAPAASRRPTAPPGSNTAVRPPVGSAGSGRNQATHSSSSHTQSSTHTSAKDNVVSSAAPETGAPTPVPAAGMAANVSSRAASPGAGRIRGGTTIPGGSHRAPSNAAPVLQKPVQGADSAPAAPHPTDTGSQTTGKRYRIANSGATPDVRASAAPVRPAATETTGYKHTQRHTAEDSPGGARPAPGGPNPTNRAAPKTGGGSPSDNRPPRGGDRS